VKREEKKRKLKGDQKGEESCHHHEKISAQKIRENFKGGHHSLNKLGKA
jgi:hypothetical protein